MGTRYTEITNKHKEFIRRQKVFFVGTAPADGRVNVSPKGMDALRVLNPQRVIWLNVTGSGNETSAHVQENGRMTLMFCAFEGAPMILRLYGKARAVHPADPDWEELLARLTPLPGARQIFDLTVDLVQTSCGFAVPLYDFTGNRDQLITWANAKGDEGVRRYWQLNNQTSLDGKHIGF